MGWKLKKSKKVNMKKAIKLHIKHKENKNLKNWCKCSPIIEITRHISRTPSNTTKCSISASTNLKTSATLTRIRLSIALQCADTTSKLITHTAFARLSSVTLYSVPTLKL